MSPRSNRFEDFFQDQRYVALKNHLYNYAVRKKAILASIQAGDSPALEVGSGMSPIITSRDRVVYCDLSFTALRILKRTLNRGFYVAADCTELPFKKGSFANIVCSEVLEHIEDDRQAISEIARTLSSSGSAVFTFPHRRAYFACDDAFVGHLRRYELNEMKALLEGSGLAVIKVGKILGLLEKVIMVPATFLAGALRFFHRVRGNNQKVSSPPHVLMVLFTLLNRALALLARLEAGIVPLRCASVVMIEARKR